MLSIALSTWGAGLAIFILPRKLFWVIPYQTCKSKEAAGSQAKQALGFSLPFHASSLVTVALAFSAAIYLGEH
jgi:hypothetical protein